MNGEGEVGVCFEGICEKKIIPTVIFVVPPELKKGVLVCLVLMSCTNSCLLSRLLYALFYS